ncbi:uncharacterized protein LODBEIA_P09550 [Lodderomyces beijingensis]|uniref:Peptide transporter PTR2 n=1 Tax=Lodderomyces beijingensis TaxID=1775926 RepID=A0ABP0ZEZ1_9ASCO
MAKSNASSSIEPVDEKAQHLTVLTNQQSVVEDDEYDYDDPRNYSTNFVDEHNPRGLRVPTKSEEKNLRRILGHFQYSIMIICFVEFAERASYYSVTGIISNFVQRPTPPQSPHGWGGVNSSLPGHEDMSPGALNQGLQTASALTNLITFLAYVVPLFGGYFADTKWGRWKVIQWGVVFGGISHVLFIVSAAPSLIENGKAGLAICILAIFTLALGTGCIKSNLLPLMLDQYPESGNRVKVLPSGEKVIVDREKTMERVTLVFYWSINIGAFFQLATSYCERRVGFWLAFFVPLILYLLMPIAFWIVKPKLTFEEPTGSNMKEILRILKISFSGNFIARIGNGTFWEYAKPSKMRERGIGFYNAKKQKPITWTDQQVLDVKQTLDSCKIFVYFIVFNLADSGLGSVETSLIGAMKLDGVPNDLFNNFNPLTIIVLIPILDYLVYPILRKYRIPFRPIWKIALGFIICAMSQVAGAVLQHQVYQKSPCGNQSTNCKEPADITAWKASSLYILAAAGECFAMTTIYELAYTRAPSSMKGTVMALFLFTSAISAALSLAITPALKDPYLTWVFAAIGIATVVVAVILFFQFFNLHKVMAIEEEERIKLDRIAEDEKRAHAHALAPVASAEADHPLEAIASVKSQLR